MYLFIYRQQNRKKKKLLDFPASNTGIDIMIPRECMNWSKWKEKKVYLECIVNRFRLKHLPNALMSMVISHNMKKILISLHPYCNGLSLENITAVKPSTVTLAQPMAWARAKLFFPQPMADGGVFEKSLFLHFCHFMMR